jgi:hypothetical protein
MNGKLFSRYDLELNEKNISNVNLRKILEHRLYPKIRWKRKRANVSFIYRKKYKSFVHVFLVFFYQLLILNCV